MRIYWHFLELDGTYTLDVDEEWIQSDSTFAFIYSIEGDELLLSTYALSGPFITLTRKRS